MLGLQPRLWCGGLGAGIPNRLQTCTCLVPGCIPAFLREHVGPRCLSSVCFLYCSAQMRPWGKPHGQKSRAQNACSVIKISNGRWLQESMQRHHEAFQTGWTAMYSAHRSVCCRLWGASSCTCIVSLSAALGLRVQHTLLSTALPLLLAIIHLLLHAGRGTHRLSGCSDILQMGTYRLACTCST